MQILITYFRWTRQLLFLFFVFVALSPCIAKEALLASWDVAYARPFNKTKVPVSSHTCQYVQQVGTQSYSVKKQRYKQPQLNTQAKGSFPFLHQQTSAKNYSKHYSGNSPPKYILYKRLKIAMM